LPFSSTTTNKVGRKTAQQTLLIPHNPQERKPRCC